MAKVNWKDKNFIESIVKESYCRRDVLRRLGLHTTGSNTITLKKWLETHNIDISHFNPYKNLHKGAPVPLNEILEGKHPQFNRYHLKIKLLKSGIKANVCEICAQGGLWNSKKLIMHLDHTNGINTDHRLENLRMLCPNCHSQTPTYSGKNNKVTNKKNNGSDEETGILPRL